MTPKEKLHKIQISFTEIGFQMLLSLKKESGDIPIQDVIRKLICNEYSLSEKRKKTISEIIRQLKKMI